VAVIIVSWNTRDLLVRAVASALRAGETEVPLEVWVVDNASTDGSVAAIRGGFPGVRVIANEANSGFSKANNQAVLASKPELVLFLNSDAELGAGALQALVEEMDAHPRCGAVVPRLQYPDGRYQASFADFPTLAQEMVLLTGLGKRLRRDYPGYAESDARSGRAVDWGSGACLLARREAWGGGPAFDESFPFYVEETDLCRRMRDSGWSVRYTPRALVTHDFGQSAVQRSDDQPALLWQGRLRYYAKHKPRWQSAFLRLMVRGGYLIRWCAWRAMAIVDRGAAWRARAHGAQVLLSRL
jgi:GT2 family glycosyltransferase